MSMFEANGLRYVFCQRVRHTVAYFELRGTVAVLEWSSRWMSGQYGAGKPGPVWPADQRLDRRWNLASRAQTVERLGRATICIELRSEITEPPRSIVKVDSPGDPSSSPTCRSCILNRSSPPGNLLLSASYNGITLDDVAQAASLYKPRFFDVALPRLDAVDQND